MYGLSRPCLTFSASLVLTQTLRRTASALALLAGLLCPALHAQTSSTNFGTVNIASSSSTVPLTFTLESSGSVDLPQVLTQGVPNLDFTDAGTGSCTTNGAGYIYSAGNTCTVNVIFTPRAAGPRYGAVVLQSASGTPIATTYIQGTGSGPQVSFLPATQSTLPLSTLVSPSRIAVDAAGNLFILEVITGYSPNNALVKETWNGNAYTQSTIATGFAYPMGLAVDGAGNVFIADQDATDVVEETPSNGGYTRSVPFSGLGNVESVGVDGSGNVYIGSLAYGLLEETPTAFGYTVSTVLRTRYAFAIAADGSGNLYVSPNDTNANALFKETLANGAYTESVIGPTAGVAVALDGAGNVYTIQPFGDAIYKETLSGGTYTQSTLATLSGGAGPITVDGEGNLYVIYSGSVLKFDYADPPSLIFAPTAVGSTSSDSPKTVTVTNSGNLPLSIPIPSVGTNPQITTNFSLNSSGGSACPLLSTTASSAGTLAAGASCTLPVSYTPTASTPLSGFVTLTDTALNDAAPNYAVQQIPLGVTGGKPRPASIGWRRMPSCTARP